MMVYTNTVSYKFIDTKKNIYYTEITFVLHWFKTANYLQCNKILLIGTGKHAPGSVLFLQNDPSVL
jgi:hypothetical protein